MNKIITISREFGWGKKENYHLCINTSNLEIKNTISPLTDYIENFFGRDKK